MNRSHDPYPPGKLPNNFPLPDYRQWRFSYRSDDVALMTE
ncbi:protein of unknown function [Caballeronia sp. S22]